MPAGRDKELQLYESCGKKGRAGENPPEQRIHVQDHSAIDVRDHDE